MDPATIMMIIGAVSSGSSLLGSLIRAIQGDSATVRQNARDLEYKPIIDAQAKAATTSAGLKDDEAAAYGVISENLGKTAAEDLKLAQAQFGYTDEGGKYHQGLVDQQLAQTMLELQAQAGSIEETTSYKIGEAGAASAYKIGEAEASAGYQIGSAKAQTGYEIGAAQRQTAFSITGAAEQTAEASATISAGAAASGVSGASVAAVKGHRQAQFQRFASFQNAQLGAMTKYRTGQLNRLTGYVTGQVSRLKTEEERRLTSLTTYLTDEKNRQLDVITGKEGLAGKEAAFQKQVGWTRSAQNQRTIQQQITQAGLSASWATLASTQYTTQASDLNLQSGWLTDDIEVRKKNRFWDFLGTLLGGVGGAVPGATMMAQNWPSNKPSTTGGGGGGGGATMFTQ